MLRGAVLSLLFIAVLYVTPSHQQSFKIQNLTTLVGSTAYFYTLLETPSSDPGQWYGNGIRLQPTSRVSIYSNDRTRQITISNVSYSEAGEYTLTVDNVNQTAYLIIIGPTITRRLQDRTVQEGVNVVLEVELSESGVAASRTRWEYNTSAVPQTARFQRSTNGRLHQLAITNVQTGDSGQYTFIVDFQVTSMQLRVLPSTPTDVDECLTGRNNCNINAVCTNTVGSFTCACRSGWNGDGITCIDNNECLTGANNCDGNAVCRNTEGSFTCSCRSGWIGDGLTCLDVNECSTGASGCHVNARCTNTQGSYTCTCNSGFTGNGFTCTAPTALAIVVDMAPSSPSIGAIAIFTVQMNQDNVQNGVWFKDNMRLFNSNKTLISVNGRTQQLIITNVQTTDVGTYRFSVSGLISTAQLTIQDVNECQLGTNDCDVNANCVNTVGSYTCTCRSGWVGNGRTCTDIDECLTRTDNCDTNAICANTAGSFTCTCRSGWSGDGRTCVDVNECQLGTNDCDVNANCVNTVGTYTCTCRSGWVGNGRTCADVNECFTGSNDCSTFAQCQNTPGSFSCTCRTGYSGNGRTCVDIDECLTRTDNCDTNAICANTAGSFTCTCRSGWSGDGRTCVDVNECSVGRGGCSDNAQCTNTDGSYTCTCNSGYTGNGFTCTAPTGVTITVQMNNVTTAVGSPGFFYVVLSRTQSGGVWYKEGVPVTNTSNRITYYSANYHYLTVFNAAASDSGRYTFQIAGLTTVGYFTVTGIPALAIVVPSASSTPSVGGSAVFTVQLNQDNVQNGVWYKDNVRLFNSSKTLVTVNGRTQQLTVTNVQAADVGTYTFTVDGLNSSSQLAISGVSGWDQWSQWSDEAACTVSCGGGVVIQLRSRNCVNRPLGCSGEQYETRNQPCNTNPCAAPSQDLCSNTQRSSGVGYRYHPTDCDKYIQCYYNPNGNVVGVYRSCPFGFYWDQGTLRCSEPWKVTCPIERCSDKCKPHYKMSGSCRAYWQCKDGASIPKCCLSGFMYVDGEGCRPNFFCRDTCPTACGERDVCNKSPDWSADRTTYNISVGLLGWVGARCPSSGSYFDITDCGCNALTPGCQPSYSISFNDIGFLNRARAVWLRDENVTIDNGVATFRSNSYFFANITQSTSTSHSPVIIKFRYRETTTVSGRRVLMSTGNCKDGSNLVIAIDNDFITFELTSLYSNLVKLPMSTAGYPRTSWKQVTLVYNGYEMMASIESDRIKYTARELASDSTIFDCGLLVGTDGRSNTPKFIGELDSMEVFFCNPGNIL